EERGVGLEEAVEDELGIRRRVLDDGDGGQVVGQILERRDRDQQDGPCCQDEEDGAQQERQLSVGGSPHCGARLAGVSRRGTARELGDTAMDAPPSNAAKRRAPSRSGSLRPWIAFPWVAVAPLLIACGGVGPGYDADEPTAPASSALSGGVVDSDASQNASVVAIEIGA